MTQQTQVSFGDASSLFEIAKQMEACEDPAKFAWMKAMLQRVIEGDRAGDAQLLAKTFVALERPTLQEYGELFEIEARIARNPYQDGDHACIEGLSVHAGPEHVELVSVSRKNLFDLERRHTARDAIEEAGRRYGLVPCPSWAAIALCVRSHNKMAGNRASSTQWQVCIQDSPKDDVRILNIIYNDKYWWCRGAYSVDYKVDHHPTYLLARPW